MKSTTSLCPLCKNQKTSHFHESENRIYMQCKNCDLVFVPSKYFINQSEEKAKYDNHQNTPQNQGYVDFLDRLLTPLQTYLPKEAKGLDFGSGPGPTLSLIMAERGFSMDIYDYFYAKDPTVFEKQYDFITSTEVIEHLYNPLFELQRLWRCLKPNGVLGLMTAFRVEDFARWYYKRDLTHIHFFTPKTFTWIAQKLDAELIIPQSGVAIMKKKKT